MIKRANSRSLKGKSMEPKEGSTTSSSMWSLWRVDGEKTILLTEGLTVNEAFVMRQIVDLDICDGELVAVSRSPGHRKTILIGEGFHDLSFERALEYAKTVMPWQNAIRLLRDDVASVFAVFQQEISAA